MADITSGNGPTVTPIHVHRNTIYLARHGESAANVSEIILPPEEDILTENGKSQADLLGKHLKDVVFTKAYASNYQRAHDTANFVLTNSKMGEKEKPELKIDERLREREMGIYVGKPATEAFKPFSIAFKNGTPMHKFEIPGGETVAEFDGRIVSFIDDLFEELRNCSKPETILIVSHGLTIVRLMTKLRDPTRNLDLQSWTFKDACLPMKNTAYHIFTVDVPSPDCPDKEKKIYLDFLCYHQRIHLKETKEEPLSNIRGSIEKALIRMREKGTAADSNETQCILQ